MGRNSELIRQWTLLRQLAAVRTNTIPKLAVELHVTTRTVRRDLAALQEAGFPIYDETVNGSKFWRMDPKAMGALARSGLTFAEASALYFSRALLECFTGTPLLHDVESALDKIEAVLPPKTKAFLDRLPTVIKAKPPYAKRQTSQTYQITAKLLDASLSEHVVSMRYHSEASGRDKDYVVHPYRLVQAQGGLYLLAFVPAYAEVRTFAVERIRRATVQQQTFEPVAEFNADPFKDSMGAHRGPACKVRLQFHPRLASLIKERIWHPSQHFSDRPDGSIVMTLEVCDDYALRSWVLGFGRFVRVLAPASLVEWTLEELDEARDQYVTARAVSLDEDVQPVLPFSLNRLLTA